MFLFDKDMQSLVDKAPGKYIYIVMAILLLVFKDGYYV